MNIEPFGVEIWMNEFETTCEFNLAETCVHSLTVAELLEICGQADDCLDELKDVKLAYGAIPGSDRLRNAIASLYKDRSRDHTLVTHGTIGANSLVHQTLVAPGDHVIALLPTYQQHYSIPASIGAKVTQLRLLPENQFLPDLDELRRHLTADTRLLAMTNPNNPTGSLMDEAFLTELAAIARDAGAWVLCDEVYRGTDQQGSGSTASIADVYEKGISTAGMSKAFSLAGLRLGWIVAAPEVIEAVMIHRDYNTISVGVIDDHFAAIALEHAEPLLARSREITRGNLKLLDEWVQREARISWVRPRSGTTALLKLDLDMPSRDFCVKLLKHTGVMFTPGSALDMEGYLRVGFANPPETMQAGLNRVSEFLAKQ